MPEKFDSKEYRKELAEKIKMPEASPVEKTEVSLEQAEKAGLKKILLSRAIKTADSFKNSESQVNAYIAISEAGKPEMLDRALAIAKDIPNEDWWAGKRVENYLEIAKAGKSEALDLAIRTANEMEPYDGPPDDDPRMRAYKNIVDYINSLKDSSPVMKSVEKIKDDWHRIQALIAAARPGNPEATDAAIHEMRKIENPLDRASLFSKIATNGRPDVLDLAFKEVSQEYEGSKDYAYADIAGAAATLKEFNAALQAAERIEWPGWRSGAYLKIYQSGEQTALDLAIEAAPRYVDISYEGERSDLIPRLADAALENKNFDLALKLAKKMEDESAALDIYHKIAKAGKSVVGEALESLKKIEDEKERTMPGHSDYFGGTYRYELVQLAAEAKDFDSALKISENIENDFYRALSYVAIAKTGKPEMLEQAFRTTEQLSMTEERLQGMIEESDEYYRALIYADIVKLGNLKALDLALENAQMVGTENRRGSLYRSIAEAISQIKDPAVALQAAEKLDSKSYAYREIIELALKNGDIVLAGQLIDRADNPKIFAYELVKISSEGGRPDLALEHASTMRDDGDSHRAYWLVMESAIENRDIEVALRAAEKMSNEYGQTIAFAKIAKIIESPEVKLSIDDIGRFRKEISALTPKREREALQRLGAGLEMEELSKLEAFPPEKEAILLAGLIEAKLGSVESAALFERTLKRFKEFTSQGTLSPSVAKLWSEALALNNQEQVHQAFIEAFRQTTDEKLQRRFLKNLVNLGNYKGYAVATELLSQETTDPHLRFYLLRLLSQAGQVDPAFVNSIPQLEKKLDSDPIKKEAKFLAFVSSSFQNLGITPDSALFEYLTKNIPNSDELSVEEFRLVLGQQIENVKSLTEEFQKIETAPELLSHLAGDPDKAMAYFILFGGRTRYGLIANYDAKKFSRILKLTNELGGVAEVSLEENHKIFGSRGRATQVIVEKLKNGLPPIEGLAPWSVDFEQKSQELGSTFYTLARTHLGKEEFGRLLSHLDKLPEAKNLGSLPEATELQAKVLNDFETLFGKQYSLLLKSWLQGKSETHPIPLGGIDVAQNMAKKNLLSRVNQRVKSLKNHKPELAAQYQHMAKLLKDAAPYFTYLAQLSYQAENPEIFLKPSGAVREWLSHLENLGEIQTLAKMEGRGVKNLKHRTLTMRYLDKRKDFVESFRFADSATCCFSSSHYTLEGYNAGSADWIARIHKDPFSFAIQLETTLPEVEKRQAAGFVFGSYGYIEGEPAILLNGVYLEGKTSTAANEILKSIEEKIAKPLGIKRIVTASRHGGTFQPEKEWENAEGKLILRPRALYQKGSEELEKEIYDDLSSGQNQANTPYEADSAIYFKKVQ